MEVLVVIGISILTFVLAFILTQIDQSLEVARLATLRAEAAEFALETCRRELDALKKERRV